ncbi:MAG: hypothetical protein Ta2D_06860 [Rickettsiales bacterium]|nr:MAG: hypothetical protein Ta2D_06860 [Rickettsiales bacterium]
MSNIKVAISGLKHSINVKDENEQKYREITSLLNRKINELKMKGVGRIDDKFLLFILILISYNKLEKIFDNFEENIVALLSKLSPILSSLQPDKNTDLFADKKAEDVLNEFLDLLFLSAIKIEEITKDLEENNKNNVLNVINTLIELNEKNKVFGNFKKNLSNLLSKSNNLSPQFAATTEILKKETDDLLNEDEPNIQTDENVLKTYEEILTFINKLNKIL